MPKEWYLSTSDDYLSGYENDEFALNATAAFKEILDNSPESYIVYLNDNPIQVIIQTTQNIEQRKMLSEIGTFKRGDIIIFKGNKWLVVDFVDDNKMYDSTNIRLCNGEFSINGELPPPELDQFGRPIYNENTNDIPPLTYSCVVDKAIAYGSLDLNNPVNIADYKIKLTFPYISINFNEFKIYGETYLIRDIDRTKSLNGAGIISITGERTV